MEPELICMVICHESATRAVIPYLEYGVFLIDDKYYVMNEHGNWTEVFKFSDTRGVWITNDGISAAFTEMELHYGT